MKESQYDRDPIPDFPLTTDDKKTLAAFRKKNSWYVQDAFQVGGGDVYEGVPVTSDEVYACIPSVYVTPDPEAIFIERHRGEWLYAQLSGLSSNEQRVVAEHMAGTSQRQISAELSISPSRTGQLLQNVHNALHAAARRGCFYSSDSSGLFGSPRFTKKYVPAPSAGSASDVMSEPLPREPSPDEQDHALTIPLEHQPTEQEKAMQHYRNARKTMLQQSALLRAFKEEEKAYRTPIEIAEAQRRAYAQRSYNEPIGRYEVLAQSNMQDAVRGFLQGQIYRATEERTYLIKQVLAWRGRIAGDIPNFQVPGSEVAEGS